MADMVERLMMRAEVDGSVRELCHDAADALESAVREIQELRDAVATLRHAADLQAEAMAERDAEVQRLQALIDAWADSHHQALVLDPPDAAVKAWMRHTVNSSRLLKAATKEDDRG